LESRVSEAMLYPSSGLKFVIKKLYPLQWTHGATSQKTTTSEGNIFVTWAGWEK
jgi:hypothetical protein